MKVRIVDWAGNEPYPGKRFNNTGDAWSFLTEDQRRQHPNATEDEFDTILGEFEMMPTGNGVDVTLYACSLCQRAALEEECESTYCGTICHNCLTDHVRECGVCHRDFDS